MIYLILISAISGAIVTLIVEFLLVYRRSPEPVARTVQYVKVVPDPALRDYFNSQHVETGQLQPDNTASRQQEAVSARHQDAAVPTTTTAGPRPQQSSPPPHSEPLDPSKPETCNFLNAIFLFLFRELQDTPVVRHWLTKKIKVEFEELLQTKTAGRLLEGLSLRDLSLGNSLPVFHTARLMNPVQLNADGMPEELNFEVDLEYNGGFHLAIDVELVFGKSAYLFVKMTRVMGRLRLQFTRTPFSHWSFSFLEDPLIDFEVQSQFEGRPLPQLTSIIVNQLKRVIKKKHTLPNYKIRYKPFFPFQVQPPLVPAYDADLSVHDDALVEGRLRVSLIECSRLFILGSYDRETYVHCTLELSSCEWKEKTRSSIKKTEVFKGTCISIGITFRQVPASEADAVHVCIETVTPNSPAALADLQRGDRLIAIGGVKVTSSVQVPKLLKQAGERVEVLYERPVRHQSYPLGNLGPLHEGLSHLEDPAFIGPQGPSGYEEDPAPISTVPDMVDCKEIDSEFEELMVDSKPSPTSSPGGANPPDAREDSLLTVNQSPKRAVANLASISPILNRKLLLVGLQSPLKPQPKEPPKPSLPKSSGDSLDAGPQRPTVPPPPPPTRPPVPPRPQIKLTTASSETSLLEVTDLTPATSSALATATTTFSIASNPCTTTSEKSPEKSPVHTAPGEKASAEKSQVKATEPKPAMKQAESCEELSAPSAAPSSSRPDSMKDKNSESTCSIRDSLEDNTFRECPETMFRNKSGRWSNASHVLEVERNHRYLNVALWCKDPFKLGSLLCLGHVSLRLESVALECMATASAEYQSTFRLVAPEPRANVSRTALRNLSTHKGFNEKLCYGDITLNFCYLAEGEPDYSARMVEREREGSLQEEDLKDREREHVHVAQRDDMAYGALQMAEVRHNFQDTQFQNPTWCEYCKKKVWTKAASQCMICSYVCHKKCQDKCLAENPFCVAATDRRSADPEAKSTINRATSGITRHIINTSSRLLNLRQVPKTRLVEQVVDMGPGTVEPSPKHTPNTSDNESSDTETYASGASPSKHPSGGAGICSGKLARREGGLDDSVFIAVKEIGRDLYRGLPTDERSQKLELMLDKLQQEIDQELERNNTLLSEEREATDARRKAALAKSGERLQALTLLMIHYRAGIEDLESVESTSPSEPHSFKAKGEEDESLTAAEIYDSDMCSPVEVPPLDDITEEQICVEALH
ncbi:PDZ domain-containing protein 8 [Gadus macrocephalus]|uniref:PDZ domain-containing protein 8 n=1 Tax=Gadus macrocephalus TaxID=80720 RepID=UPI0028CB2A6F|nr:PDZ domain-containing protein 8 [Gadus macrocephalus]